MATVVGFVHFVVVVVVAIVVGSLLQSQSFTTVYEYSTDYCPSSQDDHVVLLPDGVQRRSLFIDSPSQRECDQLHIWLYSGALHVNSTRPVIILAHGLGGQKDMGLEKYAVDFAATGYTSVAIDYRTFGGSINCCNDSDVVRNHINPWNHVEDIIATVNWVKSSLGANSIGLWGTSLAGGHMLMVANHFNRDPAIRAVVSQVPHLDGKAASLRAIKNRGILGTLQIGVLAGVDTVRSALGFSPVYIKIASSQDDPVSYMQMSPTELDSYFKKHPKVYLGGWKNFAPARTLLLMSKYSPISVASNISAPVLFISATNDSLCPSSAVSAAYSLVLDSRKYVL
jgi:dienelactone hydrolase